MDIKDHYDAAINSLMLGLFNTSGDVSIYHVTMSNIDHTRKRGNYDSQSPIQFS